MRWNLRPFRTAVIWAALVGAALVFGLAAVLESGVLTPRILRYVNRRLEAAVSLRLTASAVSLRPWTGLTLHDVRFFMPGPAGPPQDAEEERIAAGPSLGSLRHDFILSVGQVDVGYRFLGLLLGRPHLQRVKVVRPDLDVPQLLRWNAHFAAAREDPTSGEGEGAGTPGGGAGVRIDDLRILEGRIRSGDSFRISGLRLVGSLDGDRAGWRLSVENAGGRVRTDRIDEDIQITGELGLEGETIRLDGLHLGVGGGRLSFAGEIDPRGGASSRLLTSGYALSLERIGSWFGIAHPLLSGKLEFRFLTTGTPDSLEISGGLRGPAADGTGREFRFLARRGGNEIVLESLSLKAGESRLDMNGRVVLEEVPRMKGIVVFRNLDPALLLGATDLPPVSGLGGAVRFEGVGTSRDSFVGTGHLSITEGTVLGLMLDSASLHARMEDGDLRLEGARIACGRSVISGVGSIDRDNRVAAEFTGTIVDLADLGPVSGGFLAGAVKGQARAEVRILGPLAGPGLEATLKFQDASVFGARARELDVTLESDDLGGDAVIRVGVVGRDIGYGGRVVPLGTATGTWSAGEVAITNLRIESAEHGELRLGGELDIPENGELRGRVTRLEVVSPDGGVEWRSTGAVGIERDADVLSFSGLDLRSGSGRITADATIHRSGKFSVRSEGTGVDLGLFSPFLLLPEPLEGKIEFEATATVDPDSVVLDAELDLREGLYGDHRLERVAGRVRVRNDDVFLENLVLRSPIVTTRWFGRIELGENGLRTVLAAGAPPDQAPDRALAELVFHDLRVVLDAPDADRLREIVPAFPSPGGELRVLARIDGPSRSPRLDLNVRDVHGRLGVAPLDRLSANASFEGGWLLLEDALVESGGDTLLVSGRIPVEWSVVDPAPRLVAGDTLDLAFAARAFPARGLTVVLPFFEVVEGRVRADGRLTGVPGALYLEGDFALDASRVTLPEFENPLVDGRILGLFDSTGVQVTTGELSDGAGGGLTGSGHIRLENLGLRSMDLGLESSSFHYVSPRGFAGVGRGRLRVTARPRADGRLVPYFSGKLEVHRADLGKRVLLVDEAVVEMPRVPEGVNVPPESREPLEGGEALGERPPAALLAEVDLAAEKNVWLKTDEMEIEMGGEVTLHITDDYVGLTGEARALHGTYAVFNTDFDLVEGEIRFIDAADILASNIDAVARTVIWDEEITFDVSGTLGEPLIQGRSESGMSEAEIYDLLAFRRRPDSGEAGRQTGQEGSGRGAFLDSWYSSIATRIGRYVSKEVFDTFDFGIQGGTATVGVGKSVAPGVFLRYREGVGEASAPEGTFEVESLETPERQLLLEWRLSEILRIQGETGFVRDVFYVNGDLKAEWGY